MCWNARAASAGCVLWLRFTLRKPCTACWNVSAYPRAPRRCRRPADRTLFLPRDERQCKRNRCGSVLHRRQVLFRRWNPQHLIGSTPGLFPVSGQSDALNRLTHKASYATFERRKGQAPSLVLPTYGQTRAGLCTFGLLAVVFSPQFRDPTELRLPSGRPTARGSLSPKMESCGSGR